MSEMKYNAEFEETLHKQVKVKDIPNAKFTPDRFSFGDYFDMESFKRSTVEVVEYEDELVNWAFEPYKMYFAGIEEITWEQHHGDMYWFDVSVELPSDTDQQKLLAHIVADAWERRISR